MSKIENSNPLGALSDAMVAAVDRAGASTITVDARRRFPASGVAYSENLVLTADHVVEHDEDIQIGLPDGTRLAARVAGREALRGWLVREGIRVNVVMPGYVESRMCRAMPGPKPFLLSPEQAARLIRRGLERDKAHITFPFPLNVGTLVLSLLPAPISQRVLRWAGYGI